MKNTVFTIGCIIAGAVVIATGINLVRGQPDLTASSVMIVNSSKTSGGSGVVIRSSRSGSTVLTNSHVCSLVERGGLVISRSGEFMVDSTKRSPVYDLCLLRVTGNLGPAAKLSQREPEYQESAQAVGHPHLMPTVISDGRFSGLSIIEVVTGVEECTREDFESEDAMLCLLLGGKPTVKQFQSQLVSATIMPGSSGSGVFNSDGNLSNLVFAGQGDLSYGWTVPYSSILQFLNEESKTLPFVKTTAVQPVKKSSLRSRNFEDFLTDLRQFCQFNITELKTLCKLTKQDMLWRTNGSN